MSPQWSSECPEALYHTADEATGKCLWCDRFMFKPYISKFQLRRDIKSNDALAYEYYYDPNFGMDNRDRYTGDK